MSQPFTKTHTYRGEVHLPLRFPGQRAPVAVYAQSGYYGDVVADSEQMRVHPVARSSAYHRWYIAPASNASSRESFAGGVRTVSCISHPDEG